MWVRRGQKAADRREQAVHCRSRVQQTDCGIESTGSRQGIIGPGLSNEGIL